LIMVIGIIPTIFIRIIALPVGLFSISTNLESVEAFNAVVKTSSLVGIYAAIFILIAASIYFLRRYLTRNKPAVTSATWGCAYTGPAAKMQYTASSYIRTYRKLIEPFLRIRKFKTEARGIFPEPIHHETHPMDKLEELLIDKPIGVLRRILSRFTFLQSGNVQAYILYGFIFITLIVLIPEVYHKLMMLIKFLNQL
jgi:hydrogenase-4 component B